MAKLRVRESALASICAIQWFEVSSNSCEASTPSIVSWWLSSLTSQLGDTFFSNWGWYHNWHSGTCSVSTLRALLAKLVLIEHMTSLFIRVTMLAFISFILNICRLKLIQHVYIKVYRSWFSQPLCCVSRQLDDYASVYEAGCKLDTETWTRKRREAEIPDQVVFDVKIVTKEKSMMKKSSKTCRNEKTVFISKECYKEIEEYVEKRIICSKRNVKQSEKITTNKNHLD